MDLSTRPRLIARLNDAGQPLTAPLIREIVLMGLTPRLRSGRDEAALMRANDLLALQPSLHQVVLTCVSDVIAVEASSPDTDVGHSEPRWPTLLLTSFPLPSPVGDLRLLESIVHEAMHLNLSNFERVFPLTFGEGVSFSPWRSELRPMSGVLHGAYVFTCIRAFFRKCLRHGSNPLVRDYIEARLATISVELASIQWDELDEALSLAGRAVTELIRPC